jgi:plasmid stabilization system protein ParE
MESIYKLVWSEEALKNLRNIFDYLETNWTLRESQKFSRLLEKQIKRIEKNPYLFAESKVLNGLRKSVLSPQTSMYYRLNNNEIQIVTLFDNRQNPEKLEGK